MPVEITLPLTKLEQAVADARKNEQIMAAKVEDAKATLKAAKGAWEEAVGEVFRALDEMIADKRQPALPFEEIGDWEVKVTLGSEPEEPNPPAAAGQPGSEPATHTTVEILPQKDFFTEVSLEAKPLLLGPVAVTEGAVGPPAAPVTGAKHWRDLIVANQIDGFASLFDTLAVFNVTTMGQLADALVAGGTFNLPADQVRDLWELIEEVSADDETPIKFDRERVIPVTVKEEPKVDPKVEPKPEVAPEAEPEPAKKRRGRKPKAKDEGQAVAAEPEPSEPAAAVQTTFDDL